VPGQKTIRLLTVVELIVVIGWIRIEMPREPVRGPEKTEERKNRIVSVRLDEWPAEAAVVFGVVNQKRRTGARMAVRWE